MKYAMMTTEVLDKMCKCFSSTQEMVSLCDAFEEMSTEFVFFKKLREHLPSDADLGLRLKAIAMLTLFIRDNIELFHNLIQVCDIKPLSSEEVEKIMNKAIKKIESLNIDFMNETPE